MRREKIFLAFSAVFSAVNSCVLLNGYLKSLFPNGNTLLNQPAVSLTN